MNDALFNFFVGFSESRFFGGIDGNINLTHKLQINANPSNATNEQSPWNGAKFILYECYKTRLSIIIFMATIS